jgi:peptidyl-tRNA hydrolase
MEIGIRAEREGIWKKTIRDVGIKEIKAGIG